MIVFKWNAAYKDTYWEYIVVDNGIISYYYYNGKITTKPLSNYDIEHYSKHEYCTEVFDFNIDNWKVSKL